MKKLLSVLLVSSMILASIYTVSYANDIVLPDDEFEEEVTFARGDVDGNGVVNADDCTLLSKIANGSSLKAEGDADSDIKRSARQRLVIVNADDYTMLSKIANGANIG